MAGQKFTLTFDAQLNVSQMKGSLGQIQSTLNGLHLPQNITKGLQGSFDNLSKEIQGFEAALSKDITSKADFNKLNKQAEKVTSAFEKLKLQVRDITGLSNKDLERLLPSNIVQNINKATKAMDQYDKSTTQAANKVKEIQTEVEKLNQKIANANNKTPITDIEWKQLNAAIKEASNEVQQYKTELANAEENQKRIANSLKESSKSSTWRAARDEVAALTQKLEEAKNKIKELSNQKATSITFAKQAEDLNKFNTALAEAQGKLRAAEQALAILQSDSAKGGLKELIDQVSQLTGLDLSNFKGNIEDLRNVVRAFAAGEVDKLKGGFDQLRGSVDGATPAMRDFSDAMRQGSAEADQLDARMRDVSALKSRIQYFFGLNNTINLFRRAVRGAFETIKELDKAMTETAVVTKFSVGDMWEQLPEYTKRANELGVTTKAAYEAATLYYQQGLTTKEVNELSVETLKMARIAGLDAAEATDRMTNALRGFNMELNDVNAQRVDDVYSKLAAISASNVDEISTAMTKVASLAHNAGMEFETTAAFLAQIIETTRESAETAGTALKTVVARFAEVKKLVSEGDIKGQDEEGDLIDVNKVSAALRTAGIDLNRYFLGEVGIDDIFLELAKKWNELTSLQQRYIATQAAGSRQQSRFIALMADYARTQELVSAAYNANGAAAEQFGKTQDSLESKLARLKNAWNEFLMGLTNSTVVKAGVDTLTFLLNVVNKLTGAFGEGVGSVLKWTAAIVALRGIGSFVSAGGGLTKIIGALTGGAGLAAGGLGAGLGLGTKTLGKAAWGSLQARGLKQGVLSGVLGTTAAKGGLAAKAYTGLTAAGVGSETALGLSGLASLAPALLGVAGAVTAVVIAYKAWEKFTPQGQLKTATKLAEQMEENARKANEVAESYKNVQESYKQYEDAIKEATNTTERDAAIKSKNDYILSLLEKDSSLAKYIDVNREKGQIELTINEEEFAKKIKDATEEAAKANIESYFANANQQRTDIEVQHNKVESFASQAAEREMYYGSATELRAKEFSARVAEEAARVTANNYARLGYQESLKDSFLSDKVVNDLATALGNVYDKTNRLNEDHLADLQKWASSSSAQRIISTMAGNIGDISLLGMDEDTMLTALGIDETSEEFKQLALLLNNFNKKDLKQFIAGIAQANREVQENNRQRLNEKLNKAGIDQNTIDNFLNNATPDLQQAAIDAWDQIEQLINNGNYTNLADALIDPDTTVERIEEIRTAAMGINLNNPISAFAKLQDGINSTDKDIKKISEDILQSNHNIFNTGNLVQTALTNTYEDTKQVHKEIDKLIDKNGHITANNIRELAEESEDLATIIDEDVTSVEALAKALTLIADGRLEMEDLNDTVITLLENMYTFDDLVQDVHDVIANFDEGIDYGEGIDFLVDKVFELEELFDNWEFGNERTERLWNLFFSEDYRDAWDNNEDELKARVQRMKAWLDNDAYGFFNDPEVQKTLTGEVTPAGDHKLNWDLSKYNTLEDVLDDITEKFHVSTDAAKMFVEAFVSHGDEDVLEQFDRLGRNSAITAVVDMATKNKHFWTKEEIDQIAKTAGMDADELRGEVERVLRERLSGTNEVNLADMFYVAEGPLSSEDFFKQFKDGLLQSGQNFDEWLGTFVEETEDGTSLKLTALKRALSQMGYGEAEQADLIDQFQKQLSLDDEEIAVNNLKIKIAGITGIEPESEAMKQLLTDLDEILSEKINNEDPKAIVDLLRVAFKDNGFELTTESYPAFIEWLQAKLSEGDENGNKPSVDIDKLTANPIFSKLEEGTQLIAYQKISELLMTNGPIIPLTDLVCSPAFGSLDPEVQGTILGDIGTLITDEDSLVALQGLIASPTFTNLAPGSQIQVFTDLARLIKESGHIIPLDGLLGLLTNLQLEDPETNLPKVIEAITSSIIENGGTINLNNLKGKLGTLGIEPNDVDSFVAIIQTWIDDKGNWNLPEIDTSNWDTQLEEKISAWRKLWESLSSPDFSGGSPALGGAKAADLRVDTTQAENATNNLAEQTGEALNDSTNTGIVTGVTEGTEESKKKFDEVAKEIAEKVKTGELSIEDAAEEIFRYTDNQAEQSQILEIVRSKLVSAGYIGASNIVSQIQNQLNNAEFQIRVRASIASGAGAAGGTVSSRASGGNELKAGPALTGEEAPEIVWNKERGYAYITGQNGPEFRQLNPGDRVFNAAETRRIFRNSLANGGLISSYATGRWNPANDGNVLNRGKKTSSGGSSGGSNNPTVWENDLDWLYNLMEDIAELERQQTRLSEQHDRYLKDISKTGRDLYNTTKEQLNNLYTARSNQIEALTRRRQEMSEQIGISGYGNYVWWNDKDQTIEIDWDAIEAIQDKNTYDEVKDLVSRVEKIQDEMDSAQDALWDIEGQIKELEERYLQEFVNFQQRVLDAVVNQYQKQIDDLSSLNETLNDTNSRILDSISKEIDLERQIRDNTDTENNIADMEARLAYLRRDTTGANDSAIRDLEKQLSEARQNYTDTLIDQQLNRLSEANEKAADQREQQIALMTAQLEYWQETGALWQEVSQLMDEGFNSDGSLIGGSKLEQVLRDADEWKAMSEQQREVWGNELISSANQAGAYLLKISEGLNSLSAGVWAMLPSSSVTSQKLQYATGGLNKATGWAWLDGTVNEPEYVLNARQTDAFLRLSEILPSMFNSGTVTNNNLGGNVYVELTMNVSDISSDYDVDRFMDRVKTNIYDAASYRNTVGLNFMK